MQSDEIPFLKMSDLFSVVSISVTAKRPGIPREATQEFRKFLSIQFQSHNIA
jgi:hypothetical protein